MMNYFYDDYRDIIGGVIELDPVKKESDNAPTKVFRAILSNFQGRKLKLLIWKNRIHEFESKIFRQVCSVVILIMIISTLQLLYNNIFLLRCIKSYIFLLECRIYHI